ncbi:MAG: 4-hydroxy-3-methylbut-2-enyl diphosphate reductase, partial [Dehalococcoidia bacterium]|nr:4-hydroxy-3-methylbut-2-enyl diphosphate reductase [Dehalococcoidia bacterium]
MPEHVFRIQKASAMGFCSGVRRAITILEKSSKVEGPLQTLGPVVHNRQVVDRLASEGISSAGGLNEITGGKIAIPSHGVSPTTAGELSRRGLHVIDATCPTVHRAQVAAKKLADGGFFVIIFGSPDHPEVKGLLGWAGDKSRAVTDTQTLSAESLPK